MPFEIDWRPGGAGGLPCGPGGRHSSAMRLSTFRLVRASGIW